MPYTFPTSATKARDGAAEIIDRAMAAGLLASAARLQDIEYRLGIDRVWPLAAQETARGTLDSINQRTTEHYNELTGLGLAEFGEQPPLDLLGKINLDVFQTWQIGNQIDALVGEGYTAEFADGVIETYGTISEKVLNKAGDLAKGLGDGVSTLLDSLNKILKSFGSLGWVALVVLLVLAVGVAYSLSKGKVPGVPGK